jgi:hypothetical protein
VDLFDLDERPAEWDPPIADRMYYRDNTGNLGWMVKRDGVDHIKLDREGVDQTRPFRASEWKEEFRPYPITEAQIAMVRFQADKELRRFIGLANKYPNDWAGLTESQRSAWVHNGPTKPPIRVKLWQDIGESLKGMKV